LIIIAAAASMSSNKKKTLKKQSNWAADTKSQLPAKEKEKNQEKKLRRAEKLLQKLS
jgi:hypothetical protein